MDKSCKGCSASVRIGAGSLDRAAQSFRDSNPSLCVDESLFKLRLGVCMDCESLEFGSTCRHCGCIVHLRALVKGKGCPSDEGDKWAGLRKKARIKGPGA